MSEPRISSQILRHVADVARGVGVDTPPILSRLGIAPGAIDDFEAMVSLSAYVGFFEAVAAASGSHHFGLAAARASTSDSLGALSFLVLSAPTLSDGFVAFVRYLDAMQEGTRFALVLDGRMASFVYQIADDRIAPRRQDSEYSIGATHQLIEQYVGKGFTPLEVHFEHARAGRYVLYEEYFRCPVFFSQPVNRLVFDRALLERQSGGLSNRLFPILAAHLQSIARARSHRDPFARQVARCLDAHRLQAPPDLTTLATELGCSPSRFARRLKAEGSSYRAILEAQRMALAERLMGEADRPISDIALAVGFSETASFTRAFRRHFGHTPRDHVRSLRARRAE